MKTTPLGEFQATEVLNWTEPYRAIFWEQGTGKSWVTLAQAEKLYAADKIDAMLILAPNGIHTNWVLYELPAHMQVPHLAVAYDTHRASTKKHQRECDQLFNCEGRLPILAMSYDAIKTAAGKKLAKKFLLKNNCLYVLDESNRIKTPSVLVTRTVLASGRYARYKRILCGTPITNKLFDIYTQFRFLNPKFWANTPYGLCDFQSFKTFFGVWEKGYNGKTQREYDVLTGYKNVDILKQLVASISSRVLKEDVLKDLPPKMYTYRAFEMTPKQEKIYRELETEFMTFFDDELILTPLAITRMLRLQQVLCGYLPTGDENACKLIEPNKKNPRLNLLREICSDLPHPALIWARFRKDIDLITETLGDAAVRWDGSIPSNEREENKARFKAGKAQFMVATSESMGEGHTLNEAKTTLYYSNSFKMKERMQSEDRNHRAGQKNAVQYIDIVADNTLDVEIVEALRQKFDAASIVLDGRVRKWLTSYNGCDIL